MAAVAPTIALVLGLLLGGGTIWWFMRQQVEQAIKGATTELQVELSTLSERVASRDQQIQEWKEKLADRDQELNRQLEESQHRLRGAESEVEQKADRILALSNDLAQANQALMGERQNVQEWTKRFEQQSQELGDTRDEANRLGRDLVQRTQELEGEKRQVEQQIVVLRDAEQKLSDVFRSLASEVLSKNQTDFLQLAKDQFDRLQKAANGDFSQRQHAIELLVTPMKSSLEKVDQKIDALEKQRIDAYGRIHEQVVSLAETQKELRNETACLVQALRSPPVRGRWGEIQLRRVVELAGMLNHCDFYEQVSVETDDGKVRPDVLVKLPGGKSIVVDAKVPLTGFLEAHEATDEATRKEKLAKHAKQVRSHVDKLSEKCYFGQFRATAEFTVLFLPGDAFFSGALGSDPELLEFAWTKHVIIATPTTLIALLRAVSVGWQQERLVHNAEELKGLGRDLYNRLAEVTEHLGKLRKSLVKTFDTFNVTSTTFERKVLVSARRMRDLGVSSAQDEIGHIGTIDVAPLDAESVRTLFDPDPPKLAVAE